ncbi:hypothetical protein [Propioniciclava flava]
MPHGETMLPSVGQDLRLDADVLRIDLGRRAAQGLAADLRCRLGLRLGDLLADQLHRGGPLSNGGGRVVSYRAAVNTRFACLEGVQGARTVGVPHRGPVRRRGRVVGGDGARSDPRRHDGQQADDARRADGDAAAQEAIRVPLCGGGGKRCRGRLRRDLRRRNAADKGRGSDRATRGAFPAIHVPLRGTCPQDNTHQGSSS